MITGADSAAGQAIARGLAAEGMSLMLIARPGAHVRGLAEELAHMYAIRCFPASLDVTDPDAVERILMHAEQHVGAVDVLVNTVPGRVTRALLPTMTQRGRGHVANLAPAPHVAVPPPITVANVTEPVELVDAVVASFT